MSGNCTQERLHLADLSSWKRLRRMQVCPYNNLHNKCIYIPCPVAHTKLSLLSMQDIRDVCDWFYPKKGNLLTQLHAYLTTCTPIIAK